MTIDAETIARLLAEAAPEGLKLADLERSLELSRRVRPELKEALAELQGARRVRRGREGRYFSTEAPTGDTPPAGEQRSMGSLKVFPSGRAEVVLGPEERPIRIRAEECGAAIDGDRVELDHWSDWNGPHGRVIRVVKRGRSQITGRIAHADDKIYLDGDDVRLPSPIVLEDTAGATEGESVVVRITGYPEALGDGLRATVTHRLGDPADPRGEVRKLLILAQIEDEHPPEVLREIEALPEPGDVAVVPGRADLRDLDFFTIDPGDARDFDDAVCVEEQQDGWLLHVAVADVSHYVQKGSLTDRNAAGRALSVYLPDRAIHMLPETLSTGICSLAPRSDRLAMVVRMHVDPAGDVSDESVLPAVIRSRERLDYEGVAAVLAGRHDHHGASDAWRPELARLTDVAAALHEQRIARGGLDFDLPEAKVVLDEDDPLAVRTVSKAKPSPWIARAYRLIEECMVAANEAVGRFCERRKLPVPWRVHERPRSERFAQLIALARSLGVRIGSSARAEPKTFQRLLQRIEKHPARGPLAVAMLRCLAQASYADQNLGHFALAAPAYLHFTSPIRRYPDLVVHRAVKQALTKETEFAGDDPAPTTRRDQVSEVSALCSDAERNAVGVERGVVDMYRAFVMREHLGEEFPATITGVAGFGLFVQLDDPFVEGLLKREALGRERWDLAPEGSHLEGRHSGKRYRLGDRVQVRVSDASVTRRQITFELAEPPEDTGFRGPRKGRRKQRRSDSQGRSGGRRAGGRSARGKGRRSKR